MRGALLLAGAPRAALALLCGRVMGRVGIMVACMVGLANFPQTLTEAGEAYGW